MQLDGRVAGLPCVAEERAGVPLAERPHRVGVARMGGVQRFVARGKAGADIDAWVLGCLVCAGVEEMELDAVILDVGRGDHLARQGNHRSLALVRAIGRAVGGHAHVGDEDIPPDLGPAWNRIPHIEDPVGELLLEDARLHLGGQLLGGQFAQQSLRPADRPRGQPERAGRGDQGEEDAHNQHGRQDTAARYAGRPHPDDFAVARHAAQRDQDADQRAGGKREGHGEGQQKAEQRGYGRRRCRAAHEQLEALAGALQEEHEGEEYRSEEGVREQLAENGAVKKAHLSLYSTGSRANRG